MRLNSVIGRRFRPTDELSETQLLIYSYLEEIHPKSINRDRLLKELGISGPALRTAIHRMRDKGVNIKTTRRVFYGLEVADKNGR